MPAAGKTVEEVQERLRQIWEEVLETSVDGPDQDFFELGGDSLLALVVASRAEEEGLAMPPSGVLRQPGLRALAEAVVDPARFELW